MVVDIGQFLSRVVHCRRMSNESSESIEWLNSLLNRTLHVHISDGRMFAGQMKCTDNECNIILSGTQEYRSPSPADIELAATKHASSGLPGNFKVDMKKRFVGLVVVPGEYITKIELEN